MDGTMRAGLEQSISCSRVGQQWLEESLAFGMDNRKQTTTTNKQTKKPGTQGDGRNMWAGDKTESMCVGQGDSLSD